MSVIVSISDLSKSFEHRVLFQGLRFGINRNDHIGLIGTNGSGKSTLLKIISGSTDHDTGQVAIQRGLKIAYLEQTPKLDTELTVEEVVLSVVDVFEDWQAESDAREILTKLGFTNLSQKIKELSGGWQRRVALARELSKKPDLLLLDEPTNHLDIDAIFWLENYLAEISCATVIITHDRAFLQKTCTKIFELDRRNPNGLLVVDGSYADFLETKELLLNAQAVEEQKLKNKLRRETEWLRRGAKARLTKQQARQDATHQLKEKVDEISRRNRKVEIDFELQESDKKTKKLIEAKEVSKSYGDDVVIPNINVLITPKTRLGLMGPNGTGKSTLIKLLIGSLTPDSGTIKRADGLEFAYFEQNRQSLDPKKTLIQSIGADGEFVTFGDKTLHVRTYLSKFLFSPQQSDQIVEKLSGGEQARLLLARMLLTKAQLLILDEPTNDLDMDTLDALKDIFSEFQGGVILVTHDRYFMDQVCNQILGFSNSQPKELEYFADLTQWESWHLNHIQKQSNSDTGMSKNHSSTTQKGTQRSRTKIERELNKTTERVEVLESKLSELSMESQKLENASNSVRLQSILSEMDTIQKELLELYPKWEELVSELASHDKK